MSDSFFIPVKIEDAQIRALAGGVLDLMHERGMVMVPPAREEPYSVAEAAEALNVCKRTVYNLIDAERLQVIEGLSKKLIPVASLEAVRRGEG